MSEPTSKAELRKARKARAAAGASWTVEQGPDGAPAIVRERSRRSELRAARSLDRWARRAYDRP